MRHTLTLRRTLVLLLTTTALLATSGAADADAARVFMGKPNLESAGVANTALLNAALVALKPGDSLLIPNNTYWLAGGVRAVGLVNATLRLDGTLKFLPGRKRWPTQNCSAGGNPLQPKKNGTCVQECIFIANTTGLTLTSNGTGTLYGSGSSWWGYLNYLVYGENRPRLFSIVNATQVVVEHWSFQQSPYWTFTAYDVVGLTVRFCSISNRVNGDDSHDIENLAAFNTDGFDVAGRDIHIHDSSVWNQDDCFTIQPLDARGHNAQCTENVLVENVNASGLGLTIGAIHPTPGHNCIRNVTFRRARMHNTFKGIYIKSGNSFDPNASAELSNVLYEDVEMEAPTQVPIWIGPAQEADSKGACSLLWPALSHSCPPPPRTMAWENITLRNIRVTSAKQSPGIVMGNPARPMRGVVFDNVVFAPVDPHKRPWGDKFYYCNGVEGGLATNGTAPAPPCFSSSSSPDP